MVGQLDTGVARRSTSCCCGYFWYKTGDVLSLCEWKHGKYTGREWAAVITHVLPVNEIIADAENWVVLSIRSLSPLEVLEYIISNGVTESLVGGGHYGR